VVSVGGNDIALVPLLCTVANIALLACCTPKCCIDHLACAHPVNSHVDPGCMCCGLPGCLSGLCAFPLGLGYFADMFKVGTSHSASPARQARALMCRVPCCFCVAVCCVAQNRVQNYVSRLVTKTKPRKVVVCMIYHPDERAGGSWADGALCCLGYNCRPAKLQSIIRKGFELGTSRIRIEGTEVRGVRVVR
jgi:hypothetical protein